MDVRLEPFVSLQRGTIQQDLAKLMCCQKQVFHISVFTWDPLEGLSMTWKCSAPFHQGFCESRLAPSARHRQNLRALACLLRHFPSQPQLVGTATPHPANASCQLQPASYRYIPQHIDQEQSQHSLLNLLNKSKPKRIKMKFYAFLCKRVAEAPTKAAATGCCTAAGAAAGAAAGTPWELSLHMSGVPPWTVRMTVLERLLYGWVLYWLFLLLW